MPLMMKCLAMVDAVKRSQDSGSSQAVYSSIIVNFGVDKYIINFVKRVLIRFVVRVY